MFRWLFVVWAALATTACSGPVGADTFVTEEDVALEGDLALTLSDVKAIRAVDSPDHGALTLRLDGSFTYVPFADYFGDDRFVVGLQRGDGNEEKADIAITVRPVNDPPRLTTAFLPQGDAANGAAVPVHIADVDSESWTAEISQLAGPPLRNLRINADRTALTFDADNVSVVTLATILLRLEDSDGGVAERELAIGLRPLSYDGRLKTVQGSRDDPGVHLVLVGDGFAEADRAHFWRQIDRSMHALLTVEKLSIVNRTWNVHVLELISKDSGVDEIDNGIYRDTALDGGVLCGGRGTCGATATIIAAALDPALPQWDIAVTLLNYAKTVGGGGSMGMAKALATTTIHPTMEAILIHELGHGHARLADEYGGVADESQPPDQGPGSSYPNISYTSDLATIKWKRWLDVEGVGAFEGGLYRETKVWRSTKNSWMRFQGNPVDPIGAEAWALESYLRAEGAITTATPAFGAVSAAAPVPLKIHTPFPGAGQSVRWFVDDFEVASAADSRTFTCCDDPTGTRTVRVRAADTTGLIRAPEPSPHVEEGSWTITFQ